MKKAITVIQPWATLLVAGKKHIETRSWRTSYRGEIYIHAGMRNPVFGISAMSDEEWARARISLGLDEYFYLCKKFPTGAIIGKANLVNCLRIDELTSILIQEQHPDEYAFGDFTPGRYAWMMEDPVSFNNPIPMPGKQRIWNWNMKGDGI